MCAIFWPSRALSSDDFPTLERPSRQISGEELKGIVANLGEECRKEGGCRRKKEEACASWGTVGGRVSQWRERAERGICRGGLVLECRTDTGGRRRHRARNGRERVCIV